MDKSGRGIESQNRFFLNYRKTVEVRHRVKTSPAPCALPPGLSVPLCVTMEDCTKSEKSRHYWLGLAFAARGITVSPLVSDYQYLSVILPLIGCTYSITSEGWQNHLLIYVCRYHQKKSVFMKCNTTLKLNSLTRFIMSMTHFPTDSS